MTAIKSHHSRLFEQLVAKYRAQLLESLAAGHPPDYAKYRQQVGEIQGLDTALKLSEEADFKLNGEDIVDS
jgi:hypothetical protein